MRLFWRKLRLVTQKKSFLTLFSSVVTKPRNPQNNGDTWENFINRKDKSRDLPCSSNWFFSTFLVGLLLETGKKREKKETALLYKILGFDTIIHAWISLKNMMTPIEKFPLASCWAAAVSTSFRFLTLFSTLEILWAKRKKKLWTKCQCQLDFMTCITQNIEDREA